MHSIVPCVNCRCFVKSIMHWLADGEAAVCAGWMCWLKFKENTDNTTVQFLLGRGDLGFSFAELRTSHPRTQTELLRLHSTGQIVEWTSKNKTGLLANKFSWLTAASGVILIKYSWSSIWLKLEVLTIPSWTQLSSHEGKKIQGIQVSSANLLQLGLSKQLQRKKIKQLILNC